MTSAPDPAAAGASAVPVCPRHPERESYVRCQRCERPVCPECQRQAAVGVQCVDCARQGAKGVRPARTVFGGMPTGGRPLVTQVLIGLSVLGFLLQRVPGLDVTTSLAFYPYLAASEPWRYLSSAFLHATGSFGLVHLGLNMYALWALGPYLESQLGRWRFLALYLVSAVAGSVGYQVLTSDFLLTPHGPVAAGAVGASGAVFGLFGAMVVVQRRLGRALGPVAGLLLVNLALGFFVAGIAWQAHLGGMVGGLLVAAALAYAPRERRTVVQWGGIALVVVLLAVLAVLAREPLPF